MGKTYEEINCDKKQTHEVLKNVCFFAKYLHISEKSSTFAHSKVKRTKPINHSIIMKKLLIFVLSCIVCGQLSAQKLTANKETMNFQYDIECAGNGTQGTYLVKVWSYSSSKKVAREQSRKNAVHGVIFKGFAGGDGCVGQRPLVSKPGAEMEHAEYFSSFFSSEALKYASIVNGTDEVVKIGSLRYKVGCVVSVQKDQLRKALEAAGIIRGLNSGF